MRGQIGYVIEHRSRCSPNKGCRMIISALRKWKLTSDSLYIAGFVSIAASILTWARAKSTGNEAHAERFGIFVGLWAPTFMALGNALAEAQVQSEIEPLVKDHVAR
jgi:hypothetical protein